MTATPEAPTSAPPVDLRLDEAVELATAWAASVGAATGIRVLVIKGDALARMGLREPRVSADVDVLIDPERFDDFGRALCVAGWSERPLPFISSRVSPHSVTFVRPGWPCDLDVHSYFPGFLKNPAVVFDALWRGAQKMEFASQRAHVPDRLSSILVTALHAYRDGAVGPRAATDLRSLSSLNLSPQDCRTLAELATETGCDGTLHDFLTTLGVTVHPTPSPALREWNARVASASRGAYPWLLLWKSSGWRERPSILARAIWPTIDDIVLARPEVPRRRVPLLRARVQRWGRGLAGLPGSVAALRQRSSGDPARDA